MTDQFAFTYPSPLEGYENLEPLPDERNDDGKSYKNPQHGVLSKAYEEFPDPLTKGRRGGFDIHIYHFQVIPQSKPVRASHVIYDLNHPRRPTRTKRHMQRRCGSGSDVNFPSSGSTSSLIGQLDRTLWRCLR